MHPHTEPQTRHPKLSLKTPSMTTEECGSHVIYMSNQLHVKVAYHRTQAPLIKPPLEPVHRQVAPSLITLTAAALRETLPDPYCLYPPFFRSHLQAPIFIRYQPLCIAQRRRELAVMHAFTGVKLDAWPQIC